MEIDYKLETLFKEEKVKGHNNTKVIEAKLRSGQPIMFGSLRIRFL